MKIGTKMVVGSVLAASPVIVAFVFLCFFAWQAAAVLVVGLVLAVLFMAAVAEGIKMIEEAVNERRK